MWISSILGGASPLRIAIDRRKCLKMIADFSQVKTAADGTKNKRKVKDKVTGVSYEPHGHCSDAMDYFLCEAFRGEYSQFTNPKSSFAGTVQMGLNLPPSSLAF
jgi:hypothetical protein